MAPGKCADEGGERSNALERRVDGHVGEGREQRQRDGEHVGVESEPDGSEAESGESGDDAGGQREASGGERAVGGALHARVGGALKALVQCARACGDEADAKESIEQAALQGGDAPLHGAEIEAAPTRDDDEADDFDFEELAKVVDERCGGAGGRSVNSMRVRGVCDVVGVEIGRDSGLGGKSHEDGGRFMRQRERRGSDLDSMITSAERGPETVWNQTVDGGNLPVFHNSAYNLRKPSPERTFRMPRTLSLVRKEKTSGSVSPLASNAELATLMEGSHDPMWSVGPDHCLIAFNKAASSYMEEAFGISARPGRWRITRCGPSRLSYGGIVTRALLRKGRTARSN